MSSTSGDDMVDAIEDGKIVRVSQGYAAREGLLILRKPEISSGNTLQVKEQMKLTPRLRGERKAFFDIDKYRRPWHDKNEIIASLTGNFHWEVASRRKQLNLSRKQLASAINVPEEDLKMIENGNLPHNDYILISKLENYLKINLRRDKAGSGFKDEGVMPISGQEIRKPKWEGKIGSKVPKAEELVGNDVEIIDGADSDDEDKK